MLHSIPEDKINDLSLEMIIYYIFTDYPEIIDGYNNKMIKILRDKNILQTIDNLKSKLVAVNLDIIKKELTQDDEKNFINDLLSSYNSFNKYCVDLKKLKEINENKYKIKELEELEKENSNLILNNLIETIENVF